MDDLFGLNVLMPNSRFTLIQSQLMENNTKKQNINSPSWFLVYGGMAVIYHILVTLA